MLSGLSSSWLGNLGQLMGVLTIFLIVLFLTWLVTHWIAGYQQDQTRHQNLRIIETLRLTTNSYIQIIEVGDIYLIIGVSKDHIEKLAEVSKDSLELDTVIGQKTDLNAGFHDIFDKVKQHLPKK